jgi:hypothetical protein
MNLGLLLHYHPRWRLREVEVKKSWRLANGINFAPHERLTTGSQPRISRMTRIRQAYLSIPVIRVDLPPTSWHWLVPRRFMHLGHQKLSSVAFGITLIQEMICDEIWRVFVMHFMHFMQDNAQANRAPQAVEQKATKETAKAHSRGQKNLKMLVVAAAGLLVRSRYQFDRVFKERMSEVRR